MRTLKLLIVALLFAMPAISQSKKDDSCITKPPLPNAAFGRMIVQDITYAIIGENTPVSGVKVDVSKPEATISGVFKSKKDRTPWDLFGLEFKGGISDRNFSILKGYNSFNTAFEVKGSFHFIPAWNSASYGVCDEAMTKSLIINAKNRIVKEHESYTLDSFYAVAIIRNYHLKDVAPAIPIPFDPEKMTTRQKSIFIYFLKKITNSPDSILRKEFTVKQLLSVLPQAEVDSAEITEDTYYDDVVNTYLKFDKLKANLEESTLDKMIQNSVGAWTRKKYWWFTVTPFAKTEKVNEYYTKFKNQDSSYFKSDYRLSYGVVGYINRYIVYPEKRAVFYRLGISLSQNNNLPTLSSYNYETTAPFFSYGNTVTQKIKAGQAFNNNAVKTGLVKQLTFEYYYLPLASYVPGIYISSNFNHSNLYNLQNVAGRENDKVMLGLEGGLLFNINSREKDKEKSILSFLIYFRHEDVTDKTRTSMLTNETETTDDFRKRNLSMGIRFGIPINLPQRSK